MPLLITAFSDLKPILESLVSHEEDRSHGRHFEVAWDQSFEEPLHSVSLDYLCEAI